MDTLDEHTVLENYIDAVLNEVEMDEEWKKVSLKGEVKIDEIRYWVTQRGSLIQAGGHLFVKFFRVNGRHTRLMHRSETLGLEEGSLSSRSRTRRWRSKQLDRLIRNRRPQCRGNTRCVQSAKSIRDVPTDDGGLEGMRPPST